MQRVMIILHLTRIIRVCANYNFPLCDWWNSVGKMQEIAQGLVAMNILPYIYVWKNDFLWWRCLIMMFHLSFFRPQHATSFSTEFNMFVDDVFHLLLVRGESFSDLQRSFLNTSFAPPLLIISCFPLPFISSQHPFSISVHQMGYKKVKGCRRM